MKKILGIALLCLYFNVSAQTKTEKITKDISFEITRPQNTLIVANIFGSISVEGYSGSTISVEVEKTVSGKTQARFDKGMADIQLGVLNQADTVILYVKGTGSSFGKQKKNHGIETGGWGYDWQDCGSRNELEFDYKMTFRIKVPMSTNLILSTINDGDVTVTNINSKVSAHNINGAIHLTGISQAAVANTINGDVDVTYNKNPDSNCRFYTLNGDINANFKKGLSSRVAFKSFNGEFYTNVPQLESLPVEVEKTKTEKGVKYSVNGNQYKAGNGGVLLDFETFNGNVYLREQ
jgi:hypothetical protein